ncbi:MAG: hypothetical protein AXW15_08080 [Neptuniibacter sp. Phe_28]|nr:MAG: hypothetical protein AXW15_08080 [Neptuniibacter sp. Phe_28]
MNIKIGIGCFSALIFSLSAAADSGAASTEYKGGFYDMAGYLNKTAVVGSVQSRQEPRVIKGGPFDMNGYLNLAAAATSSTLSHNNPTQAGSVNLHANPNLLFVPSTSSRRL